LRGSAGRCERGPRRSDCQFGPPSRTRPAWPQVRRAPCVRTRPAPGGWLPHARGQSALVLVVSRPRSNVEPGPPKAEQLAQRGAAGSASTRAGRRIGGHDRQDRSAFLRAPWASYRIPTTLGQNTSGPHALADARAEWGRRCAEGVVVRSSRHTWCRADLCPRPGTRHRRDHGRGRLLRHVVYLWVVLRASAAWQRLEGVSGSERAHQIHGSTSRRQDPLAMRPGQQRQPLGTLRLAMIVARRGSCRWVPRRQKRE